jgi:hypothetical protein
VQDQLPREGVLMSEHVPVVMYLVFDLTEGVFRLSLNGVTMVLTIPEMVELKRRILADSFGGDGVEWKESSTS